ncbi:hypothetical protein VRB67_00770 [Pseudomonas trivialis]|uniref:hypothetical protein n=1 Tax=Pseudomonas trivialis TaxID=200450 RepID=UPI0030CA99A5
MMLTWDGFVEVLGCSEADSKFVRLTQTLNELPNFEEGVLGDRRYYSFFSSGILLLLENNRVDQVVFYTRADEGFSIFKGQLPVPPDSSESKVIHLLGTPSSLGGGKLDMLLGYIDRWVKYEMGSYTLHFQFDKKDVLSRLTLGLK